MKDPYRLRVAILNRLSQVIDPETGVDVVRMRLIEDLSVDKNGRATYTFRPSSPLCPIAVFLASKVLCAVAEVEGVTGQDPRVTGYVLAEELTEMLKQWLGEEHKHDVHDPV
jgi:metal-sulfur cluster biosynthetic enzyme